MTYGEAQKEMWAKWFFGLLIAIPSALLLTIIILKTFYERFDGGDTMFGIVADRIANAVRHIIYNLSSQPWFPLWIWNNSPLPDTDDVLSVANLPFLMLYLAFFFGMSLFWSGNKIKEELRRAREYVRQRRMAASYGGAEHRPDGSINIRVQIDREETSLWAALRDKWLIPIIVGVIVGGLLFAAGWSS